MIWLAALTSAAHASDASARIDADRSNETGFTLPELRVDSPRLALGTSLGAARYARIEGAGDFGFGPLAELSVGAQLFEWGALEGHYFVARHEGVGVVFTHAQLIAARFSWPGVMRPFVSVGAGQYENVVLDASGRRRARPRSAGITRGAVGIEAMLSASIGIQAEAEYSFLFTNGLPDRSVALASLWGATLGSRFYF